MKWFLMICLILVFFVVFIVGFFCDSDYQPPRYTVKGEDTTYEHCSDLSIGGLFSRYVRFTAENGNVIYLYGEFTVVKEVKNGQNEN